MTDQSIYIKELVAAGFTQEQAAVIVRIMNDINAAKDTYNYSYEIEDKSLEAA